MTLLGLAFWGLLGAFVYAGPRLVVSLTEPGRALPWLAWTEFSMSLAFGPIGATGFTQLVANIIHWQGDPDLRALALVIGMVVNPVAPAIVHLVTDVILRRLNAPLKPIHHERRRHEP